MSVIRHFNIYLVRIRLKFTHFTVVNPAAVDCHNGPPWPGTSRSVWNPLRAYLDYMAWPIEYINWWLEGQLGSFGVNMREKIGDKFLIWVIEYTLSAWISKKIVHHDISREIGQIIGHLNYILHWLLHIKAFYGHLRYCKVIQGHFRAKNRVWKSQIKACSSIS